MGRACQNNNNAAMELVDYGNAMEIGATGIATVDIIGPQTRIGLYTTKRKSPGSAELVREIVAYITMPSTMLSPALDAILSAFNAVPTIAGMAQTAAMLE